MAKDLLESPFVIDPKHVISAPTFGPAMTARGKSLFADLARHTSVNSGSTSLGDEIRGRSFDRIWMDELSTRATEDRRAHFEHEYMTSASIPEVGSTGVRGEGGPVDVEKLRRILAGEDEKDKRETYMRMLVDIDQGREHEEAPRPAGVETQDEETGSW
ncbi:hypothetical protein [Achromobacter sp. AGC39]